MQIRWLRHICVKSTLALTISVGLTSCTFSTIEVDSYSFYLGSLLIGVAMAASALRWRLTTRGNKLVRESAQTDLIAKTIPQIIWRTNPNGTKTYLSPRFSEITGNQGTTIQQKLESIHPDDRQRFIEDFQLEPTSDEVSLRFRLRHQDGSFRWMLSTRRAVRDERSGKLLRWVGSLTDIESEVAAVEELKRLSNDLQNTLDSHRAELREVEERFQALFHDLNVASTEGDISVAKELMDRANLDFPADFASLQKERPDLVEAALQSISISNANPALAKMLGYDGVAEMLSRPLSGLIQDSRKLVIAEVEAIFSRRRHFTTYSTLIAKDGRDVPVAVCVNFTADWTTCIATHLDVTERQLAHEVMVAAREELARANRATAVGAMSASLAHELNQPILAMLVDAQTALRWLKKNPPASAKARDAVDRITKNVARMGEIVSRTRERLVRADRRVGQIDLVEVVRETRELVSRDVSARGVKLRWNFDTVKAIVTADKVEMQQVIVNLVNNAADALASINASDPTIWVSVADEAEKVIVTIEDNGPGIPHEQLEAVFAPFFTTKQGGMGMGLQICQSILQSSGGELTAVNRKNGGARFQFSLEHFGLNETRSKGRSLRSKTERDLSPRTAGQD